jgi:hypothetical protein
MLDVRSIFIFFPLERGEIDIFNSYVPTNMFPLTFSKFSMGFHVVP